MGMIGAVLGSFSNMLIWRLPRQEKWVYSRSKCPHCGVILAPIELIPIVSYLIQRGKCRHCRALISPRYLIVELVFVLGALLLFSLFGWSWELLIQSLIWATLLTLFVIDLETLLLPIELTGLLIVLGLLDGVVSGQWLDRLEGAMMICLSLALFRWLTNRFYRAEAFGGGDVLLGAGMGAILGLKFGFMAVYFGFMVGGLVGVTWLFLKKGGLKSQIAFGPSLIAGTFIASVWGSQILKWIFGH